MANRAARRAAAKRKPAQRLPEGSNRILSSNDRATAVKMFRDLADRLEREELHGARIQWRIDSKEIQTVELHADWRVDLNTYTLVAPLEAVK